MWKGLLSLLVAGLGTGTANAVILKMVASDGSGVATIDAGGGNVYVAIETAAVDTIPVSFVLTFFDVDNQNASVNDAVGQLNWVYDRSAFKYPASLGMDGGNEYGLVSGDSDGGDGLPLGEGIHWIDCLTISGPSRGSTLVTIETGLRDPQVFGPPPTYTPYLIAPPGSPPNVPNKLYLGDENSNDTPFAIVYIPEPAALALLALGGVIAIRRRSAPIRRPFRNELPGTPFRNTAG